MEDLRQSTIDTYNKSAKELANYFRGIGSRVDDIELALKLAGNPKRARIVEVGCGDGRDAKEIMNLNRGGWYQGFDISEKLLELARRHVPGADFVLADAATYKFPDDLDIVFAFASLLHLSKEEVKSVLSRACKALKTGGIFYISLKYAPQYEQKVKEDRFGKRLFYFYNTELIQKLAGESYETVLTRREVHGHTEWVEVILRKVA